MKTPFATAALVVLFSLCLQPSRSAAAGAEVSSVWQVKSETNTIYLAGSIPFLREEDQPLAPQFEQAYKASRRVVFEVDPKESKDEKLSQDVIRMGMFTDGGSIRDGLSKETYTKLGDFLAGTGAPRAGMDQFRPWFAAIMISMTELIKVGVRPDLGVGELVENWALKDEKPISGLESMKVELDLLKDLPQGAHEHMLKSTLEDVEDSDQMEKEFGKFIAAWRSGDVGALEKMDAEDDTKWDQLMQKKLVRDRDAQWMKQIEKELAGGDGGALYVVGLSHLIGEGSLLEQLAAKGYQVSQLKVAEPDKNQDKDPDPKQQEKKKKKPALIPVVLHH